MSWQFVLGSLSLPCIHIPLLMFLKSILTRTCNLSSLKNARITFPSSALRAPMSQQAATAGGSTRRIRGVIFDMDGTLTVPCIDFVEMRRRIGLPPSGGDILDIIGAWPEDKQKLAHETIAQIEREALERLQIMPGVTDLCKHLDQAGVPRAIVTRNVSASVDYFHNVAWAEQPFRPALSREFRPYKPHPAAILHICAEWGIRPEEAVMIGDSARDDIASGNRAGSVTILFDSYQKHVDWVGLEGETRPTFRADSMSEILEIFRREFILVSPAPEGQGEVPGRPMNTQA